MKSIFISGSGQCGESFVCNILKNNDKISAFDETKKLSNSFYKFSKYNQLPIDEGPFFNRYKNDIIKENKKKKIRLESSSYLSFHLGSFYEKYNSKLIILMRNPYDVAIDLEKKGWYKKKYYKENANKIIGYQGISNNLHENHHNFSRICPKGKYFYEWNKLDPLLKIKWFWNETYRLIFKDLKKVPKENYKIIKIEEFDYSMYLELCRWLLIKPNLSELIFNFKSKIIRKMKSKKNLRKKNLFKSYKSNIEQKFYYENNK